MEHRTRPRHPMESSCVSPAVRAFAHHMKQAGVDDCFESRIPGHQFSRVLNHECDCGGALARFDLGFLDRNGSGIESDDAIPLESQVDCVLSRATTGVQNLAVNFASLHDILEELAGAICVPRWPA